MKHDSHYRSIPLALTGAVIAMALLWSVSEAAMIERSGTSLVHERVSGRVAASMAVHRLARPELASTLAARGAAPRAMARDFGHAGMAVEIDPETGQLVPASPGRLRTMNLFAEPDPSQFEIVTLPDGSLMVDVSGHLMNHSIARIDASGRVHRGCVHDLESYQRFLKAQALRQPEDQ